jgi:hypothetical protein
MWAACRVPDARLHCEEKYSDKGTKSDVEVLQISLCKLFCHFRAEQTQLSIGGLHADEELEIHLRSTNCAVAQREDQGRT